MGNDLLTSCYSALCTVHCAKAGIRNNLLLVIWYGVQGHFEMKCLRQVLRVSWTAKKTNECLLNTAGVQRSLLASVKERKLVYFGHVMRKKGDSLEKEIMQGTTPGSRSRGRPRTAWMLNITSWTGLSMEQLLRAVEDRYQWRLTAHDAANLRAHEDGWRRTYCLLC